jgi:hypothetical protein
MIQVKEFLNYQEGQDTRINEWLKEQGENIEIIDIKYSVGVFFYLHLYMLYYLYLL